MPDTWPSHAGQLRRRVIQHMSFESDGSVQVSYYTPTSDVTTAGAVHLHTLLIEAGFDYDDEISAVLDAADHLIGDVLEDWPRLPKFDGTLDPREVGESDGQPP